MTIQEEKALNLILDSMDKLKIAMQYTQTIPEGKYSLLFENFFVYIGNMAMQLGLTIYMMELNSSDKKTDNISFEEMMKKLMGRENNNEDRGKTEQ